MCGSNSYKGHRAFVLLFAVVKLKLSKIDDKQLTGLTTDAISCSHIKTE